MTVEEAIWLGFRVFDSLGAIVAGVLLWRKMVRRISRGELDDHDVQLRIGLVGFLVGCGLLFARAIIVAAPGGAHLALIAVPLLWTLRPLLWAEHDHWKGRRNG